MEVRSVRALRRPLLLFAAAFVTCTLLRGVSEALFAGATLAWPVAGVAFFWIREHRGAGFAGVFAAVLLVASNGDFTTAPAAGVEALALTLGLWAMDTWLKRIAKPLDFQSTATLREFISGLLLGAGSAAAIAGAGALALDGSPLGALNAAAAMFARLGASVALIAPPLLFLRRHRLKWATIQMGILLGAFSAASTAGLRVTTPIVAFLAFLILPTFVWLSATYRTKATVSALFSTAVALLSVGLLVPNFHPTPVVALSFTWSAAGFTGLVMLYLAATLSEVDQERREQQRTSHQLRLALAAANDRLWDWDVRHQTVRVESPNADGPSEVVRMGIDNWMSEAHPEDLERMEEQRFAVEEGRSDTFDCDHRVASTDLTWRWLSTKGSVIERGPDGKVRRVVGTSRDISTQQTALLERQALERRMALSQRLESLGVLAGGVAHDFNNLLLAILGNVELSLEAVGETPELLDAKDASLKARELCSQLLAYAGHRPTALRPAALAAIVSDMFSLLRTATPEHINLDVNVDDDVAALVDIGQIRQVILNLVINAGEALGEEMGAITVRGGVCDVSPEEAASLDCPIVGEAAFIEVDDDGPGMDARVRDRLFDPFFTTKFQGRGLGMAAVLGIVRAHDGAVVVNSRRGKGTKVRLLLQRAEVGVEDASTVEVGRSFEAPVHRGEVIVADDEPAIRRTLERALSRRGYRVTLCSDGDEALRAVEARADDCALVLMDVVMPKLTGRDALPRVRALAPELQVILMSGYDIGSEQSRPSDEPCVYLQKPFSLATLDRALAEATASRTGPR